LSSEKERRILWPEGELERREDGSYSDAATDIRLLLFRCAAFRRAADTVVEHCFSVGDKGQAGWADQAFTKHLGSIGIGSCQWADLSFAVGNLYRHHVELLLKVLILLGRRLAGQESNFPQTHRLADLWAEARPWIVANVGDETKGQLGVAEELVGKLSGIEAATQEFRYPPSGEHFDKSLPSREQLRDLACPLGDFLAGCADIMWHKRLVQKVTQVSGVT